MGEGLASTLFGLPLGGKLSALRTVEGYFITPAPHPSLTRHLLPKEKACLPSCLYRFPLGGKAFRGLVLKAKKDANPAVCTFFVKN